MVWFLSQPQSEVSGKSDKELYEMYDEWIEAEDEADWVNEQQSHYMHDLYLRANGVGGVL